MASAQQEHHHVTVHDGQVHITGLVETDPHVYRVLAAADDPDDMTHAILRIGEQATLIAGTDLDAQVVERLFENLARNFDSSVTTAVSRITQAGTDLLGEDDGALPRLLDDTKAMLKAMLDGTFDPDSKSSAIAKIDAAFDRAVQQVDRKVRATLDPDAPDSALGKAKREILDSVKEQARDQGKQLQELAIAVAAGKARANAAELTAVKGFAYEDLLHRGLASIAVVHGDIAEPVGRKTGLSGRQNGDHLVTINGEDTCGQEARFVLECKDRRLSMAKTMDELAKASRTVTISLSRVPTTGYGMRSASWPSARPKSSPSTTPTTCWSWRPGRGLAPPIR